MPQAAQRRRALASGCGALQVLGQLVTEDNDALLREYRERLAERTGVTVCLAVICEALKRLKLRPKKRHFGRPSGSLKMAAAVYLPATKRARSGNRTGCDGGSVGDASFQQRHARFRQERWLGS